LSTPLSSRKGLGEEVRKRQTIESSFKIDIKTLRTGDRGGQGGEVGAVSRLRQIADQLRGESNRMGRHRPYKRIRIKGLSSRDLP